MAAARVASGNARVLKAMRDGTLFPPALAGLIGYFGIRPAPGGGLPGAGPLSAVEPRTSGPRAQVQEHYLVGAGTGIVVGSGRLTGFVRVVWRRPADVVLRVVLEPLRGGRGGDDRQVRRDVLRDRLERRGLLGGRLGRGHLGQH